MIGYQKVYLRVAGLVGDTTGDTDDKPDRVMATGSGAFVPTLPESSGDIRRGPDGLEEIVLPDSIPFTLVEGMVSYGGNPYVWLPVPSGRWMWQVEFNRVQVASRNWTLRSFTFPLLPATPEQVNDPEYVGVNLAYYALGSWSPGEVEALSRRLGDLDVATLAVQRESAAATAARAGAERAKDDARAVLPEIDSKVEALNEAYDASEAGQALPPRLTETSLNATYADKTDNGKRPVGKDEQIHDVRDHGADPSGANSSSAAINALLATGVGHVLIAGGTYLIDAPIRMAKSQQRLTLDESATLHVPPGYSGDVFLFDGGGTSMRGAVVDGGGTVTEIGKSGGAAVEPGHWSAVHFRAQAGAGTTACRVDGPQFNWPGTALKYTTVGTGWVNGNVVDKLRILYYRVLVETIKGGPAAVGFASNTVSNLMAQSGSFTTHGVKTLSGRGWTFQDVSPWDMPPGSLGMDVNADARAVRVIGGILSARGIVSRAPAGEVDVHDFHSPKPWHTEHGMTAGEFVPDTSNPLVATVKTYDGWPVVELGAGAMTEVSAYYRVPPSVNGVSLRAVVLGMHDSPGDFVAIFTAQSAPGGAQSSRSLTLAMTKNAVVESEWVEPLVVSPGSLVRLKLRRAHNATSADTLAGPVGLIGYLVKPTSVRS